MREASVAVEVKGEFSRCAGWWKVFSGYRAGGGRRVREGVGASSSLRSMNSLDEQEDHYLKRFPIGVKYFR